MILPFFINVKGKIQDGEHPLVKAKRRIAIIEEALRKIRYGKVGVDYYV